MIRIRKSLCLLLCAVLLGCGGGRAEEMQKGRWIPELLKVTVDTREIVTERGNRVWLDEITTANEDVNADLAEHLGQMAAEALPLLNTEEKALELTASYRISGSSWASFLLVRRISIKRQTQQIDFRCLSYDLATGKVLTLPDALAGDQGWELLADTLKETLMGIYPQEPHNIEAIDALCHVDAIRALPFMVGTYQLMLPVALNDIVPGKQQIVHTTVFFDQLWPHLSKEASLQLDNSGYAVVALTFDDGPVGTNTRRIVEQLGRTGANATFFAIGDQLERYGEGDRRAADTGCLLGSHTMHHLYSFEIDREYALRDREQFIAEM